MVPELVARTPAYPIFGARSGLLLDPEDVRIGRKTELDSLRKHRVVEEVPNSQEGLDRGQQEVPSAGAASWQSSSQPVPVMTVTQSTHLHCWSSG